MLAVVLAMLTQASPAPSADDIFLSAQHVWQRRAEPAYVEFHVGCNDTFLSQRCPSDTQVDFVVRTRDGLAFAQTIPTSSDARSHVLLQGFAIAGPVGTPFGFYRALTAVNPPPLQSATSPQLAPTIASVKANGHVYDVALANEETVDGRLCYHLTLHPEIDPDLYPLRSVWVEESTYEVVELIYDRPFTNERSRAYVWYHFAPVGPAQIWTVVHISAVAMNDKQSVDDELRDITFPATAPDWYFQPTSL